MLLLDKSWSCSVTERSESVTDNLEHLLVKGLHFFQAQKLPLWQTVKDAGNQIAGLERFPIFFAISQVFS